MHVDVIETILPATSCTDVIITPLQQILIYEIITKPTNFVLPHKYILILEVTSPFFYFCMNLSNKNEKYKSFKRYTLLITAFFFLFNLLTQKTERNANLCTPETRANKKNWHLVINSSSTRPSTPFKTPTSSIYFSCLVQPNYRRMNFEENFIRCSFYFFIYFRQSFISAQRG